MPSGSAPFVPSQDETLEQHLSEEILKTEDLTEGEISPPKLVESEEIEADAGIQKELEETLNPAPENERKCKCKYKETTLSKQLDAEEKEEMYIVPPTVDERSVKSQRSSTSDFDGSITKVFNFDAENHPDMDKCMKFWNGVLKNKLKIKTCPLKPRKAKKPSISKNEDVKVDASDVWLHMYDEVQRKNLDKVKLGTKNKCKSWQLTEFYPENPYEKIEEEETIIALNNWMPSKSKSSTHSLGKSKSQRYLEIYFSKSRQKLHKKKSRTSTIKPREGHKIEEQPNENKEVEELKEEIDEIPPENLERRKSAKRASFSSDKDKPKSSILKETAEETQEIIHVKKNSRSRSLAFAEKFGCLCGCELEDCTCSEFIEATKIEDEDAEKCCCSCAISGCICKSIPEPRTVCLCGCELEDCLCEKEKIKKKEDCRCGCDLDNCICEDVDGTKRKYCFCGCGLEDCLCHLVKNKEECLCGCNLEDCLCEDALKKCGCGHDDCKCYEIAKLRDFLRDFEVEKTKKMIQKEGGKKFVDCAIQCGQTGAQLDNDAVLEKSEETVKNEDNKQKIYCAICGHFNCFCKRNAKK